MVHVSLPIRLNIHIEVMVTKMAQQVLIERFSPAEAQLIVEASNQGKDMFLVGNFMSGNVKNKNQRVYPTDEIAAAVGGIMEQIKGGYSLLGELDHPDHLTVSLDRVSHMITEMRMQGDYAVGKAKILNTPTGNIARALVEGGVKLGVSSRGSGEVGHDGKVRNFSIVTVDIVSNPSGTNCYVDPILESYNNQRIMTLAEAVCHDNSAQKYFKKEMTKMIAEIIKV